MELHVQTNADFERLVSNSAEMQKVLRKAMRRVLTKALQATRKALHAAMQNDPRAAYKAVRRVVYKKSFGGNINILSLSRAKDRSAPLPGRRLRIGKAGGNRLRRSERTIRMMQYYGQDRGFVLRFMNSGTGVRQTRYGSRGSLPAKFNFTAIAKQAAEEALPEIQKVLDKEAEKL